jgi:hypothetical protein
MFTSFSFGANCQRNSEKITESDFTVKLSSYRTNSKLHVIVMPPTGGMNFMDRSYARQFCHDGMNAYILESWSGDDEYVIDYSIHNRLYARAQRAIQIVMDSIPAGEPVGILGTSVGALFCAQAIGSKPRLETGFAIVGGAHIAEIIVRSTQNAMEEAKEIRRKKFNFQSDEEYLRELDPHITIDPYYMDGHKGKTLGMVYSPDDVVVPGKNQKLLMEIWQPEKVITISHNHMWSIINSWLFHQKEISNFFKESLVLKL